MAYLFGILICIAVPGLIASLLKPKYFSSFLGKKISPFDWSIFFALVVIGSIIGGNAITTKPKALDPALSVSEQRQERQKLIDASPNSGDIQYTLVTKLEPNKPLSGRIDVITPEKRKERIVQLNDTLMAQFKANKQLDGAVNFYIDYFDDQQSVDNYFSTQNDKSVSPKDKSRASLHYIAVMIYNEKFKVKDLYFIQANEKIKSY